MQNYWAQQMMQSQPQNRPLQQPPGMQQAPSWYPGMNMQEPMQGGRPMFGQGGPIPLPKPGMPPNNNPIPMPKPPIFGGQRRPWDEQPFDPRFGYRPGP